MVKKQIIWTNTASSQLRQILDFWVDHNQSDSYSLKLLDKVEKNLLGIVSYPERSPESIFPEMRVAAMNHYSIYYKITEEHIVVTAFWDNRQDPRKLFELLKRSRR